MPDSALYHYRLFTAPRPTSQRFWYKATELFIQQAFYDSALICVENGLKANPRSAKLVVQFAGLLQMQKRAGKADSLLQRFLLTDSSNQEVIAKKVELSSRRSDHGQVIDWGEKLLADSADLVMPFVNLAYSYLNVDSARKSIAVCEWLSERVKPTAQYCIAQHWLMQN